MTVVIHIVSADTTSEVATIADYFVIEISVYKKHILGKVSLFSELIQTQDVSY